MTLCPSVHDAEPVARLFRRAILFREVPGASPAGKEREALRSVDAIAAVAGAGGPADR